MGDMTNATFIAENYRNHTVAATVHFRDGEWSSDSRFGNELIDSAHKLFATDEERIEYFSTFTNQSLSFRRVEVEEEVEIEDDIEE
jgi:hypothetical protein